MHIVALALLAFVLGWVYSFVTEKLSSYVPSNSFTQSTAGKSLVTGVFILASFLAATFVLRTVGLEHKGRG